MIDLFGNQKDDGDFYSEYLRSPKWSLKRKQALAQAGEKCERCGQSKWTVRLEVHHLTYERLGHEDLNDLQVLCKECHILADKQREEDDKLKKLYEKKSSSLVKGFQSWVSNKREYKGKSWRMMSVRGLQKEKKLFLKYIKTTTGNSYSIVLEVFGFSDDEKDWTP